MSLLRILAVLTLVGAHPSAGQEANGVFYTVEMNFGGPAVFHVWVSGANSKVVCTSSQSPQYPAGVVLMTRDNGETLVIINGKDNTYVEISAKEFGDIQRARKPEGITFRKVEAKRVLEEDGPITLGQRTRRFLLRISITIEREPSLGQSEETGSFLYEMLMAPDIQDQPPTLALLTNPALMGVPEFDETVRGELASLPGFPLRRIARVEGQAQARYTVEVTSIERQSIPSSVFEVPAGYREISRQKQE